MTRVILVKPGDPPCWVALPPSFEAHERGEAIRKYLEDPDGFECYNIRSGWVAYGGKTSKQRLQPVNEAYLELHRRFGGIPDDMVAGPVLLCGTDRWGDEVTPRDELRAVFGDLWPED
jgi:hypothetical protein